MQPRLLQRTHESCLNSCFPPRSSRRRATLLESGQRFPSQNPYFSDGKKSCSNFQQLFDIEIHTRQAAVIWGPSGFGKTQLALEYLTSRDMDYEVILWIDSSSRTMVEESFEHISLQLESGTKSMKSGVDSVVEWLERQSQSLVIVFDGVESMEDDDTVDDFDIRDYFPVCKHGHLLLVTTSSDLHLRLAYPGIEIQGVDDQTGAIILLKCAGIACQHTSSKPISNMLGVTNTPRQHSSDGHFTQARWNASCN